jgi:hypothetical protein
MKKWYTMDMPQEVPKTLSGRDEQDRIDRGRKDFNPYAGFPNVQRNRIVTNFSATFRMYLIKQVPDDPKLLEMCFDCHNFQYQLKDAKKPVEDHIFQTIFLNKKDKETWTIDEIKEDKISKSIHYSMATSHPSR